MKVPFRPETNFPALTRAPFGLTNVLKRAFYLERFRTRLVLLARVLVIRLLLNNLYLADMVATVKPYFKPIRFPHLHLGLL